MTTARTVGRALTTVFTVVVSVAVAAILGDSAGGKILAALIIAAVIVAVELLRNWATRRSRTARRLLRPPGSLYEGVWIQKVRAKGGSDVLSADEANSFSVIAIDFQDNGFHLNGRAYDSAGTEVAVFESDGNITVDDPRQKSVYVWDGRLTAPELYNTPESNRRGITEMTLRSSNSGDGQVHHLGKGILMDFDITRVTTAYANTLNLKISNESQLYDVDVQQDLAHKYASVTIPHPAQLR